MDSRRYSTAQALSEIKRVLPANILRVSLGSACGRERGRCVYWKCPTLGGRSSSGGTRKPRVSVQGFADVRGEDDHI